MGELNDYVVIGIVKEKETEVIKSIITWSYFTLEDEFCLVAN